jgi:hypothetical protein
VDNHIVFVPRKTHSGRQQVRLFHGWPSLLVHNRAASASLAPATACSRYALVPLQEL